MNNILIRVAIEILYNILSHFIYRLLGVYRLLNYFKDTTFPAFLNTLGRWKINCLNNDIQYDLPQLYSNYIIFQHVQNDLLLCHNVHFPHGWFVRCFKEP